MGFFDPPYEKLRLTLSADLAGRAEEVLRVAEQFGSSLSFHHREELKYNVMMAWLLAQIKAHGGKYAGQATPVRLGMCVDQADRIGRHFTPAQGMCFDWCVRHIESHPEIFEPAEDR